MHRFPPKEYKKSVYEPRSDLTFLPSLEDKVCKFNALHPTFKILNFHQDRWEYIIAAYELGLPMVSVKSIANADFNRIAGNLVRVCESSRTAFQFLSRGFNLGYLKEFAWGYLYTREYEIFFEILQSDLSFEQKRRATLMGYNMKAVFEAFKNGLSIEQFDIQTRLDSRKFQYP
jgi:hypothetical protein